MIRRLLVWFQIRALFGVRTHQIWDDYDWKVTGLNPCTSRRAQERPKGGCSFCSAQAAVQNWKLDQMLWCYVVFLQTWCCSQRAFWLACFVWAMQAVPRLSLACRMMWSCARLSLLRGPAAWRVGPRWQWPLTPSMSTSEAILSPKLACFAAESLGPTTSPSLWASSLTKIFQWCWWRTGMRCRPLSMKRMLERRGRYVALLI